ncbi:hypothetical protein CVU83_01125, partial [Candidatus Falkowbacteria bacterium HGW-Falkowbacteria-2]
MATKHSGKLGIDLNKYDDREGLTISRMHFGLWLSENRRKITRGVVIFLIVASAAMFIYSSYNYVFYYLHGRDADNQLVVDLSASLIDSQAYREANAPKPLDIGPVTTFAIDGKYDFLVSLKNVNEKHYSNFQYCLVAGEEELACGGSFILPDSEKNLLIPSVRSEVRPSNVRLVIADLFWQRLNTHLIPNWSDYQSQRLNVAVSDLKYNNLTPGFHNLSFKVKNNSPYSYLTLPLSIVLYNGQAPSGINIYNIDKFYSGEEREVNLSWRAAGERVTRADV